mmetsp:Transcript_15390/g.50090  ORF Transcript_15390/g.50090 Transcript_15390/m.50090 type:complete len:391 (-) Transcript_15390:46-1218(-)
MGLFAKAKSAAAPPAAGTVLAAPRGAAGGPPAAPAAAPVKPRPSTPTTTSGSTAGTSIGSTSSAGSLVEGSDAGKPSALSASSLKLRAQAVRLGLPPQLLVAPCSERVEIDLLEDTVPLGSGEFCTAHSASLRGERVALKMLRPARESSELAISDLRREIAVLSQMCQNGGGHPNIVRLVAHGYTPTGSPFCALELFTQPLSAALPAAASKKALKEWPLARGIAIGLQVATALDYIHDGFMPGYRVLHRDLKPSNVGLARRGGHERAMLADFGLLKIWKRGEDDGELRRLTGLTGSLRYMAPEVALSQPYNHKAEVFSFTSLLYHVLSLEKPFAAMDAKAFVAEACHKGRRCPLAKAWPAKLRRLMTEGWAADPTDRPDFEEAVRVLEAL